MLTSDASLSERIVTSFPRFKSFTQSSSPMFNAETSTTIYSGKEPITVESLISGRCFTMKPPFKTPAAVPV